MNTKILGIGLLVAIMAGVGVLFMTQNVGVHSPLTITPKTPSPTVLTTFTITYPGGQSFTGNLSTPLNSTNYQIGGYAFPSYTSVTISMINSCSYCAIHEILVKIVS